MSNQSAPNTSRERFLASMEYGAADRVPNYELGAWIQTRQRWESEGAPADAVAGDWFSGLEYFDMDRREFIPVDWGMRPPFEHKVLERTERYEIFQDAKGMLHKALLAGAVGGARMSMDQYIGAPIKGPADFAEMKKRYDPHHPARLPKEWEKNLERWRARSHALIMGRNCGATGFYWRPREWMGTEELAMAWYEQPGMMHEMMDFFLEFTIETCRPIIEKIEVDYFNLNEDFAMKTGPLLGPDVFREFIFPRLKKLVEFFKGHGCRYIILDSDGNCEALIPLMMDAGVDCIWPLERASNMDPARLRRKFGKSLRLWGGVDKRELAKGPTAIDAHLRSLAPMIEAGGFIPTVDHTVPPDVSWDNFRHYMDRKLALLAGELKTGL